MAQLATLEGALSTTRAERDDLAESKRQIEEEVANLRRLVDDQKQESQSRQSMLEEKIKELIERTLPEAGKTSKLIKYPVYL